MQVMTAMLSHPEKGGESRDQQDKRGNGIIAERRVLESFQRELTSPSRFFQDAILVGAVQHNDPAPIADSALKAASTAIEIRTSLCFIILLHEHSVKTSSSPCSRSVSAWPPGSVEDVFSPLRTL